MEANAQNVPYAREKAMLLARSAGAIEGGAAPVMMSELCRIITAVGRESKLVENVLGVAKYNRQIRPCIRIGAVVFRK